MAYWTVRNNVSNFLFYAAISQSPQNLTQLHNSLAKDTVISVFIKQVWSAGCALRCLCISRKSAGDGGASINNQPTTRVPLFIQHLKVCTKTRSNNQIVDAFMFTGQNAGNLLSLGEGKLPVMTL